MQMRSRLKAIASLVDKGVKVIDIGCDHALLDIYLTLYNKNKCIASDINKNAFKIAQDNVERYNLSEFIPVILSDGLHNLDIDDNYTAVICGMGTSTILNILNNKKVKCLDNIIAQSNNDLYGLRKKIVKKGYYIKKEVIIKERNIFYVIIKFSKGKKRYSEWDYFIGPTIRSNDIPLKEDYLNYLLNVNNTIISKLPKKYYFKRFKLKTINKLLLDELKKYSS